MRILALLFLVVTLADGRSGDRVSGIWIETHPQYGDTSSTIWRVILGDGLLKVIEVDRNDGGATANERVYSFVPTIPVSQKYGVASSRKHLLVLCSEGQLEVWRFSKDHSTLTVTRPNEQTRPRVLIFHRVLDQEDRLVRSR